MPSATGLPEFLEAQPIEDSRLQLTLQHFSFLLQVLQRSQQLQVEIRRPVTKNSTEIARAKDERISSHSAAAPCGWYSIS